MPDNYSTIACDAKYKSIPREEIEIITSKWMLQRLPIAFAQVKGVNTFENLLN